MKKLTLLSLFFIGATVIAPFNASAEIDQVKKNEILNATDQAVLLETLQAPGVSEDDIFMKGIACRRLTVIGNADAVPTLAKMLASENEQVSYFARYTLEMLPFESVNPVLLDAAKNLTVKNNRLGAILSLGVRGCAEAVPALKDMVKNPKTTCDKKTAYAALGMIATEEAANFLMECAKNTSESEIYALRKQLADAMLDAAQSFEKAGNLAKATQIYDAVVVPCFPVYAQKAGAYHGLLTRKAQGAEILVSKLHSPKECCLTGGVKTIREYADEDGVVITKTSLDELAKLSADRKVLVIRAVGDRQDVESQKLVFPILKQLCMAADTEAEVKIAAIQALKKVGQLNPMETVEALIVGIPGQDNAQRGAILDVMVETASALKCVKVDAFLAQHVQDAPMDDVALASAFFRVIENRRVTAAGPELVKIANREGINPAIRDRVLAALSEIVTLDNLNLLVVALNGEQDDAKVGWILRAACTRLPREDCAVAVAKMFDATTDAEEKGKMLTLLKQIGGKSALACLEKACWDADTADIATQTLGTWNTPDDALDVAAACLKLAKGAAEERYQIRGIRSYVRIARQFDLPKEKKFEMCRMTFETAKRQADKVLIFEVFKRIIEVDSAREAFSYATDPACTEAACDAVVAIAKKYQGISPEFGEILEKVVKTTKNAQLAEEAKVAQKRLNAAVQNAPIQIILAVYGAGDKTRDVTGMIQKKFAGKALIPMEGTYNDVFSDVAPGVVKKLVIVVKMKDSGETRTLTFKENQAILLPVK